MMHVYIIRMIKDKTAHGIFWANNPIELSKVIDEKEDPGEFECLLVEEAGGLLFNEGYAEWKVGVKEYPGPGDPDWDVNENPAGELRLDTITRNIEFSESMNEMLLGRYEILGFVPLSDMLKRA